MARTFLRHETDQGPRWAERIGDQAFALDIAAPTTGALITLVRQGAVAPGAPIDPLALRLLSPITGNQQFIAQATNYRSHVREVGIDPDSLTANVFFTKAPSSLCAADSAIIKPGRVRLLDYEVELGLVVAKPIRAGISVTPAMLGEWLGGLVIVNDISARDIQVPEAQFFKGKSFRTFSPAGPWLVVPEPHEWALLPDLRLSLWVNGTLRQDSVIRGDMIFEPAATLAELSTVMDLDPGDLIITGTPGGVALQPPGALVQKIAALLPPAKRWAAFIKGQGAKPGYLRPGDTVRATIRDGSGTLDLGEQVNRVVDEIRA